VVRKGSDRCPRFSSVIPRPSSAKETRIISPTHSVVVIVTVPLLTTYGRNGSGAAIVGNTVTTVIATTIARINRAFRLFLMCHLLSLGVEMVSKYQHHNNRR